MAKMGKETNETAQKSYHKRLGGKKKIAAWEAIGDLEAFWVMACPDFSTTELCKILENEDLF